MSVKTKELYKAASRRDFIIAGPQGTGKTDKSNLIASIIQGGKFVCGDVVRASPLLKKLSDDGSLVPDEIINEIIYDGIKESALKNPNGIVIDGVPRTESQIAIIKRLQKEGVLNIVGIVILEGDINKFKARLEARRTCDKCGIVTDVEDAKIKGSKDGKCFMTGCDGVLYQRVDDTPASIQKRINTYFETTAPATKKLAEDLVLIRQNTEASKEIVNRELTEKIKVLIY
ncbi:MAG: nucleoside monophosphate kinase [Firmicutes bacterium]|nr:nucleoside monophosphate kinase [Bacillota bacterium]